jgi:hypothetical protein
MEWVALVVWVLVAAVGLPLGQGALVSPALGLQALTSLGGLVLIALFIISDGRVGFAWGSLACGVVGTIALTVGAARLISEERPVSAAGVRAEEIDAFLAGLQAGLYPTVTLLTLPVALKLLTVTS